MADEKDKKLSFKEFAKKPDEKQINEVILPTGTVDKDGTGQEETDEAIPAIFATIHHKSEHRPDGYTPEEIEELNRAANAHIPELNKKPDEEEK